MLVATYSQFVFRHKIIFILLLVLLTTFGGYHYNQIQDNNSVYEMLNVNEPADRYYLQQYAKDFGKDDFVYVAFEVDDVFSAKVTGEFKAIHSLLENLEIQFDTTSGQLIWPEDATRPFSEKLRHALKPYNLKVNWTGEKGTLALTPAEIRKGDETIKELVVYKTERDGKSVGYIKATRLVYSIHNLPFLADADLSPTPEQILNHWRTNPLTANLLYSEMTGYDQDSGEEHFSGGKKTVMIVAQLKDFKNRDELRQSLMASVRSGLASLSEKTGTQYHLAGIPILNAETTRTVSNDHFHREPLIFAFIVITLLLLFRSGLKIVFFPLGVIVTSLMITLGFFELCGGEFNWLTAILPMMITITSLSDSIHMIEFLREEVPADLPLVEKIKITAAHNWKPCLYTCLTNMTGMISLILWQESPRPLVFFGMFCAVGFVITLWVTYTFFPLTAHWLLSKAPVKKQQTAKRDFFAAMSDFCLRHNKKVVLALVLMLPFIYVGINKIQATVDVLRYFNKQTPIGSDLHWIDNHFRGLGTWSLVFETDEHDAIAHATLPAVSDVVDSKPLDVSLSLSVLRALQSTLECSRQGQSGTKSCDWENFKTVNGPGRSVGSMITFLDLLPADFNPQEPQVVLDGLVQLASIDDNVNRFIRFFFSPDGNKIQMLRFVHAESSEPINQLSERIQGDLNGFCAGENGGPQRCHVELTGIGRVWNQMTQRLTLFLKKSFLTASLGILLIMMVFFFPRLDLSILSFLPNLLPTLAILAVVGYSGIPLDMSTAMVASVALGLLVDDSMHLLHFFKSRLDEGKPFDESVAYALRISGRAVVSMSFILCFGFSVLAIGNFMPVVRVGRLLQVIIFAGLIFELIVTPSLLFAIYKPWWMSRNKTRPSKP